MPDAFNLNGNPADPVQIQGGAVLKNATFINVVFPQAFPGVPVVLLTPYWKGANAEVKHVDTIQNVTTAGFTVGSENVASNFYLMWIAVYRA